MPTYSYLKTDIINTSENDSTEFADQITYFVNRAEDRLIKELDDSGLDYYTTVTFTASNPTVSLPDGALVVRNVNYKTSVSSNIKTLLQRPYEYAIDYWGYASTSTGTPRYYARKNNTSIYIVPTPASTLTGEIQYTKRPLALASATDTSATTSNYFSEFCYTALFNACMIEANVYMKSWNTIPLWESQYKNSIDALRNQARRTRQDDMEIAASPAGGPDTIIQGAN
mgnify:CR=1 FL=1|jgi:hypothetical protein